jgi:hypothetical protein
MSSRAASPRVLVFAAVVAAHAVALLVLLAETRTRLVHGEAEASPLIVILFQPRQLQARAASAPSASRAPTSSHRPTDATQAEVSAPALPAAQGAAIDWTAEGTRAAARQIEADALRDRQVRALTPKPSPMFAARPKHYAFHWGHASTHRVEPVAGLGTVIHLNDECAIFVFVIIPIAGGCALEKTPARGDLFEHLHDLGPAPEP